MISSISLGCDNGKKKEAKNNFEEKCDRSTTQAKANS